MRWSDKLILRFRSLLRRSDVEAELEEELRYHLERQVEENVRSGMTLEEARHAALLEFGGAEQIKEACRDQRGVAWIETLSRDLRYGIRVLARSPAFTTVAVLTIGVGLAANTLIFTFVNAILIQPPPYWEPDDLVVVFAKNVAKNVQQGLASLADFQDWKVQNQVFIEMVAVSPMAVSITGDGEAETVHGHYVTPGVFRLLGIHPMIGRGFLPEEERPGGNPSIVLFHSLWQQRYGGDPAIIGKKILLDFEPHTVVGVMPPRFRFPNRGSVLMLPMRADLEQSRRRGSRNVRVYARLKPEATVEQAQVQMEVIARRIEQRYPETNSGWGVDIVTLDQFALKEVRPALFLLFGAAGFLLLIACVNVMSLSLARTISRQEEMAIRSALGAGLGDVLRLALAEGLVLAASGGIVGLLLACGTLGLLNTQLPAPLAGGSRIVQLDFIEIDLWVLGFTLAVSMLAALLVGLAPASLAARPNLNEVLKDVGWAPSRAFRGRRAQDLLVIGETAIALVLVVGAGLMLRSLIRLQNVDPGLQQDRVLTFLPMLPYERYDRARRKAFYEDFVQRAERLLPVISAAGTSTLPMVGWYYRTDFGIEGRAVAKGEEPRAIYRYVTINYFQTLGIPLLAGRCFNQFDTPDSPRVVLIDEELARRYIPGENPVGKRVTFGGSPEASFEIVGVVGSIRDHGLEASAEPVLYFAEAQFPGTRLAFVLRTRADPMSVLPLVRVAIRELDPDVSLFRVSTLERRLAEWNWQRRLSTLLVSSLAGIALLLAAVGLYGLTHYAVTRQAREIGIRIALGATRRDVLKLAVSRSLRLAVLGTVIGIIFSRALTRVIASQLYGVDATDPPTYGAVSLLLIGVSLVASYIPAWRATNVDPMVVLRHE